MTINVLELCQLTKSWQCVGGGLTAAEAPRERPCPSIRSSPSTCSPRPVSAAIRWRYSPTPPGLSDAQMQSLAAEMNLSETTFVLPPADPAHTARMRIFNRTAEMPFAGHPSVGTGYVLAQRGGAGVLTLEVPAGVVEVTIERDAQGAPIGAVIAAPQPLSLGAEFDVETIAACAGVDPSDIVVTEHRPGGGLGRRRLRHRPDHRGGAGQGVPQPRRLPCGRRPLRRRRRAAGAASLFARAGPPARADVLPALGHLGGRRDPAAPTPPWRLCAGRSPPTRPASTRSPRGPRWAVPRA